MKRIKRTAEPPFQVRDEIARRRRYPEAVALPAFGATLRYRLEREYSVGDSNDAVLKTEFFGWICVGRRRVGAFVMNLYDACGCGGDLEFCEVMDADEAHEHDLSVALCRAWRWQFVNSVFGPILEFRIAWIKPGYTDPGLFHAAAWAVINMEFSSYHVLVLKAFPLEYESCLQPSHSAAFNRRRKAMERYYGLTLGVKPLPGKAGRDGWLWAPNPKREQIICRPPERKRR